jgi:hypothetical protein
MLTSQCTFSYRRRSLHFARLTIDAEISQASKRAYRKNQLAAIRHAHNSESMVENEVEAWEYICHKKNNILSSKAVRLLSALTEGGRPNKDFVDRLRRQVGVHVLLVRRRKKRG